MTRQGRPVRVLQVLTCDGYGGTELMVAALVERMDREVVESSVATLDAAGPIARRLAAGGFPVYSLGGDGLRRAFVRLGRLLRRNHFDVVVAYGFKSTAVTRVLVRLLAREATFISGVRGLHVSELERIDGLKSRLVLLLERLGSPLVDIYDANSRGAVELLAKNGVDRWRLRYIPNGIDAARFEPRANGGGPDAPPTILCVARFVPRKRHVDLVLAAARLREAGLSFRLVLAGHGPELVRVRALTDRLGLGEVVTFTGRVDEEEVRRLLQEADVFCLPSLWEGMPGSVMEAMASRVPVVATRVNGADELVEHGRSGLLVPPERPDLLAAGLRELITDGERREAFGAEGRRRIRESFSLDSMVAAKQDLYTSAPARG